MLYHDICPKWDVSIHSCTGPLIFNLFLFFIFFIFADDLLNLVLQHFCYIFFISAVTLVCCFLKVSYFLLLYLLLYGCIIFCLPDNNDSFLKNGFLLPA